MHELNCYDITLAKVPLMFAKAVVISVLSLSGCQSPTIGDLEFPEGEVQLVVVDKDIHWSPCPPHLPSGCEIHVLEGSPKVADLFTVRFKVDSGFYMPPHTHPKDERVTLLSGKVLVAFGENATRSTAKQFGPGDYYVNKRGEVHAVWADTVSVIQITGIGPWEADFVDK